MSDEIAVYVRVGNQQDDPMDYGFSYGLKKLGDPMMGKWGIIRNNPTPDKIADLILKVWALEWIPLPEGELLKPPIIIP